MQGTKTFLANLDRLVVKKMLSILAIDFDKGDSTFGTLGISLELLYRRNISSKTANYAETVEDEVTLFDATAGNLIYSLLTASSRAGRVIQVKKTDVSGNTVTIDPAGSETIDGATTKVLTAQYESVTIVSDGSNWHVLD